MPADPRQGAVFDTRLAATALTDDELGQTMPVVPNLAYIQPTAPTHALDPALHGHSEPFPTSCG